MPVCETIKQGFKLKDPFSVLQAARLGKDAIEIQNPVFLEVFQNICLPLYEQVGEFRKEDQEDDRGIFYFSNDPTKLEKDCGNSFLRLVLESIEVWAMLFPKKDGLPTKFYLTYSKLVVKQVMFPIFKYYKSTEIKPSPLFREPNIQLNRGIQEIKITFQSLHLKLNQQAMQKQPSIFIYIKSLASIIEEIQFLGIEIISKIEQSQDDSITQELQALQEEIKTILFNYNQLQTGILAPEEYAANQCGKPLNERTIMNNECAKPINELQEKLQEKEKQLLLYMEENEQLKRKIKEYELLFEKINQQSQ